MNKTALFVTILALLVVIASAGMAHATQVTLKPSNTILDSGQTETYTANIIGGLSPYTIGFFNVTGNSYSFPTTTTGQTWLATNAYPTNVATQSCVSGIYEGQYVYCVGGYNTGSQFLNTVYYAPLYSNAIGTWTATNSYPISVNHLSCVTNANTIYCIGGQNYAAPDAKNLVYWAPLYGDGAVGTWTATNPIPTNEYLQSCVHFSAYVYCVGGYNNLATINTVYMAYLSNGNGVGPWTTTTPYPVNVMDESCGINIQSGTDANIICVGGGNIYNGAPVNPNEPSYNYVYSAPIVTQTGATEGDILGWNATTAYPVNVEQQSCAVAGDYLNCIAGDNSVSTFNQSYYALLTSNGGVGTWNRLPNYDMQINQQSCVGNAFNEQVYCIGGWNQNDVIINTASDLEQPGNSYTTYSFIVESPTENNAFVYNEIVVDSTPATGNSISNTILVNNAPTIKLTSPDNSLTPGQSMIFDFEIYGGAGPFTIELYNVSGGKAQGVNVPINLPGSNAGNGNSVVITTNMDLGTFVFNAIATDLGTTTPVTFNSTNLIMAINGANVATQTLAFVSLTASNSLLDLGQQTTLTATISGGTAPYTYNFIVTNSANAVVANYLAINSLTSNSFVYVPAVTGTQSIYLTVTDSSSPKETVTDPLSITVNPTAVSLIPSIDPAALNSIVTYTITVNKGTGPFTVNLFNVTNSLSIKLVNSVTINAPGNSNTIRIPANIVGTFEYNAIVTDTGTNTPYSFNSATNSLVVTQTADNNAAITLTPSNSLLDSGQIETYTVTVSGGVGPFTIALLNITSTSKQVQTNVIIPIGGGSNTISFTTNTAGKFTYYGIATDKGSTPSNYVFAAARNTIIVNGNSNNNVNGGSNSPVLTITPNSTSLIAGETETFTFNVVGGTGPYNIELYNVTGGSVQGPANTITTLGGGNAIISFATANTGTFTYYGIATDAGTSPSPFVFNSASSAITVSAASTTTIPNGGGGGGGGGGGSSGGGAGGSSGGGGSSLPSLVSSDGCEYIYNFTIPNEVRFSLGSTGFDVVDNYIGSNYTSVIVNGATYVLPLKTPVTINGTNAYMSLLNVSYLPIEHTVTVEACPSQTTSPLNVHIFANFNANGISIIKVLPSNFTALVKLTSTSAAPGLPKNYTGVFLANITLNSTAVSFVNFTVNYQPGANASRLQPEVVQDGLWVKIPSFSTNSTANTISFEVPILGKSTTIGLLAASKGTPFVVPKTSSTTTVPQKPIIVPTVPGKRPFPWWAVGIGVVVAAAGSTKLRKKLPRSRTIEQRMGSRNSIIRLVERLAIIEIIIFAVAVWLFATGHTFLTGLVAFAVGVVLAYYVDRIIAAKRPGIFKYNRKKNSVARFFAELGVFEVIVFAVAVWGYLAHQQIVFIVFAFFFGLVFSYFIDKIRQVRLQNKQAREAAKIEGNGQDDLKGKPAPAPDTKTTAAATDKTQKPATPSAPTSTS